MGPGWAWVSSEGSGLSIGDKGVWHLEGGGSPRDSPERQGAQACEWCFWGHGGQGCWLQHTVAPRSSRKLGWRWGPQTDGTEVSHLVAVTLAKGCKCDQAEGTDAGPYQAACWHLGLRWSSQWSWTSQALCPWPGDGCRCICHTSPRVSMSLCFLCEDAVPWFSLSCPFSRRRHVLMPCRLGLNIGISGTEVNPQLARQQPHCQVSAWSHLPHGEDQAAHWVSPDSCLGSKG